MENVENWGTEIKNFSLSGLNSQLGNEVRSKKCCFPNLITNKPRVLCFLTRDNNSIF